MENQIITLSPDMQAAQQSVSLQDSVTQTLQHYIGKLDGQAPNNLYELVISEVERPLVQTVLKFTSGNQSRAAIILGISRGTLRKMMAKYALN